jgi:hypothetical protein
MGFLQNKANFYGILSDIPGGMLREGVIVSFKLRPESGNETRPLLLQRIIREFVISHAGLHFMLPHIHNDAEACVEAVFSFVKPTLKSDLERRFAGPLVQRIFGQFPDLEYAAALQRGQLPPNIEVHDFFFQAGAFLNSPLAQQGYTSLNYTYATKHVLTLGVNVFGQLIAKRGEGDTATYSLASNTDLSLEVFPVMLERRKSGPPFAVVGQVNSAMPYMEGEAEIPGRAFDHILEGPAFEFPLFAPPKEAVSLQDYAAAIHTAALVKDGGAIQLGIGAFSDAHPQADEERDIPPARGSPRRRKTASALGRRNSALREGSLRGDGAFRRRLPAPS